MKHQSRFYTVKNMQKLLVLAEAKIISVSPSYEYQDIAVKTPKQLRGVFIRFKNGVNLSVQWGVGSYCDRGDSTCEIMAMNEKGDAICIPNHLSLRDYNQVIGHVDKDKLLLIMQECSKMVAKIRKDVGCSDGTE